MHLVTEIMLAVSMVLGTFLILTASVGVVRLPDVFCRMHAAGKAGTLGIVLIIIAAILVFARDGAGMAVRGVLAIVFQFLTIPAATHLLARASYVSDYPLSDRTAVDELKTYLPSRPDRLYGQE